ncbi:cobalt ECF transporter T component CbiQ [Donghicola mangrovi]|uniref:Cobalt ECF transporter T component CbiQ n=1 Tax=Donghicola mangrovi TaxID=2729614 RepID=A0A850Q0Y8_9RHOB|nr:cobalt ECF transporter T component CbiQ [Donghicola mangrovi]NVO23237.1 cobalt ECF transporter T component CbiQ [Donghicola mangrovi]
MTLLTGDHLTERSATLRGLVDEIDPRARILLAVLYAVVVVSLSSLHALTGAMVASLTLLALSPMPAGRTLRRMVAVDGFIVAMLVMLPFSVPGDAMFTLWGLTASWQGLWQAVEIALTANAVVLALMVLVGSLEPVTLGHALHALKCPESLVHLMMFTIRYIEVLRDEYARLRTSMKVRGFRPRSTWHTYRSYGYLVGMMLVRALERSERILVAMKCRGFQGRIILLEEFRLSPRDVVFALVVIGVCAALVGLEAVYGAA